MKVNFKNLGTKAAGLAVGTFAAGFVAKQAANFKLTDPAMVGALLIGAGAYTPTLAKGQLAQSAGDGMIAKGVDLLLRRFAPQLVSGTEDYVGESEEFIADSVAEEIIEGNFEENTSELSGAV